MHLGGHLSVKEVKIQQKDSRCIAMSWNSLYHIQQCTYTVKFFENGRNIYDKAIKENNKTFNNLKSATTYYGCVTVNGIETISEKITTPKGK